MSRSIEPRAVGTAVTTSATRASTPHGRGSSGRKRAFKPRTGAAAPIIGWVVAAVAIAALSAPARAQSIDELYAKARDEKSLTIYAGGPVSGYEGLAHQFEKAFPGIAVTITGGFSNVLNGKIEQQFGTGKVTVDLALFQTAQDFVRWKRQGRLLAFKPEGADAIPASFRDPDGDFIVWYVAALSYAYNPRKLPASEVPKSALDFLKPQFRGKLISCYPFDDDATLYVFYTLARKYGDGFIDKYLANAPHWVQGHLDVARAVAAGQDVATLDASTSTVASLKRAGQPIEFAFSQSDPVPLFYSTAGIFRRAPHPNAAKLYLTWILQRAQQSRIGTYSPRDDVPPPFPGLKPLSQLNVAATYRDFVTDDDLLRTMRKRFESAIGPIKNVGGVR